MSDENTNNSLVTIDNRGDDWAAQTAATVAELRREAGRQIACNCNPADDEGYDAYMLMQLCKPNKINDNINTTLAVTYVMVRKWEQTDGDSGEITDRLRTIFMTESGECWSTNSAAVAELALTLLMSRNGRAKFTPPLTIRFSKERTLSGNDAIIPIVDPDSIRAMNRRGDQKPTKGKR